MTTYSPLNRNIFLLYLEKIGRPFGEILKVNEGTEEQRKKNSDLWQGDIKIYKPDAKGDANVKRNALRDRRRLWHTRDIAYTIVQDGTSAAGKDLIVTFRNRLP